MTKKQNLKTVGLAEITLFAVFISFVLTGCGEKTVKESKREEKKQTSVLEGDIILAHVNDSPITKNELEQNIRSVLGKYSVAKLDKAARKKMLESMVISRAISQAQAADLSSKDKIKVDKKIQSYKEQLLVKLYLAKHTPPQPVSDEMVEEYYNSHPERFGGKTIRKYEMIYGKGKLITSERNKLIKALGNPTEAKDWKKWVKALQAKGYPVTFRQGQVNEKILLPKLRQLMSPLKKGETSQLSFIRGIAYLVRISDEDRVQPKPLSEIKSQIRKALVPVQLKKAIKLASDQVLKNAKVVYYDDEKTELK